MNCFDGRLLLGFERIPLNNNHVLLRSSLLKSTEWVYLLALYTGSTSKIIMSMDKPRTKRSSIESKLGYIIASTFCFMLLLSLMVTALKLTSGVKTLNISFALNDVELFFVSAASWMLNLGNLVPISLIVTVEMVKLLQTKLIGMDPKMAVDDFNTRVNCSNILEDLGVIDYVATDKTGTLTKNKLTMRRLSDGMLIYNQQSPNIPERLLMMLATAHEVSISSQGEREGTSQDEMAILDFCKEMGVNLTQRTFESLTLVAKNHQISRKILRCIEFTSERKRQSVLFEEHGQVWLVVKGADESMLNLINATE